MKDGVLTWTVTVQVLAMIGFTGLVAAVLLLLAQRRRPLQVHVLTHEVNATFEEWKERFLPKEDQVAYVYTDLAKERLEKQGVQREDRP
jgi:hypothetical protein